MAKHQHNPEMLHIHKVAQHMNMSYKTIHEKYGKGIEKGFINRNVIHDGAIGELSVRPNKELRNR